MIGGAFYISIISILRILSGICRHRPSHTYLCGYVWMPLNCVVSGREWSSAVVCSRLNSQVVCGLRYSVVAANYSRESRLWCSNMLGGKMQGLTVASLKKNPMLLPLFFCIGVGAVGSALYLLRLATRNPDVSWFPNKNSEPFNEYKDKEYKFITIHHRNAKSQAPEY